MGLLVFVGGVLGGLICVAFLVGLLFTEPAGLFIAMAIVALVWHVAGKPWTRAGREQARRDELATQHQAPCDDDEEL